MSIINLELIDDRWLSFDWPARPQNEQLCIVITKQMTRPVVCQYRKKDQYCPFDNESEYLVKLSILTDTNERSSKHFLRTKECSIWKPLGLPAKEEGFILKELETMFASDTFLYQPGDIFFYQNKDEFNIYRLNNVNEDRDPYIFGVTELRSRFPSNYGIDIVSGTKPVKEGMWVMLRNGQKGQIISMDGESVTVRHKLPGHEPERKTVSTFFDWCEIVGIIEDTTAEDQEKELKTEAILYLKMKPDETKETAEARLRSTLEASGLDYLNCSIKSEVNDI